MVFYQTLKRKKEKKKKEEISLRFGTPALLLSNLLGQRGGSLIRYSALEGNLDCSVVPHS